MYVQRNSIQHAVHNTFNFSDENFTKLQALMHYGSINAGSTLFWEGQLADKLYYIINGRVKISKSNNEGKEFILYIFQEGDFVGELNPHQDSKQSFRATALENCQYGAIQKSDLEDLLCQHGDLAVQFLKWMGLIHRLTQTKFRDLLLYGKLGALCSTLIRLSNSYGEPYEDYIVISNKVTNTELADYIGAARESVNRMLAELQKANTIDYNQGYIVIKNLDHLRAICHCENCPKEICRV